jgi:hypothetical protein
MSKPFMNRRGRKHAGPEHAAPCSARKRERRAHYAAEPLRVDHRQDPVFAPLFV